MFENARTRAAVLEIMKDDVVTMALHDPMESRTANSKAWAEMAGVIMRFSTNPGYRHILPPPGLSARQRAIWLVHAYSKVVASLSTHPQVAIALSVAASSYAERQVETATADKAQTTVDRLLAES